MSWTPREERAINHYARQNGLRLMMQHVGAAAEDLETNPDQLGLLEVPATVSRQVEFQDEATDELFPVDLALLLSVYDQDRAERTKERARARRAAQAHGGGRPNPIQEQT